MQKADEQPLSEFMRRYDAIMNGGEKLDTPAKLQAFWSFAHEQGNKHWNNRELIAGHTLNATWKWSEYLRDRMPSEKQKSNLNFISTEWSTFEHIGHSSQPDELSDRVFSDRCWEALAIDLNLFDITQES